MIGLGTNVLLRLVEDSDPEQRVLADALVRAQGAQGCFVNPIVLAELAWTLARTYKQSRNEIADRLELILEAQEFVVANADEAERAIARLRKGRAEFADYFLAEINRSAGCDSTATFDKDAGKSGDLFAAVPLVP
jgi:predicted nucleic-acid-binding protein